MKPSTHMHLYSRIGFLHFLRGYLPFYTKKELINPVVAAAKGKKLVWRNSIMTNYKITEAFQDKPNELANYLFLKTREREMLRGRVYKKSETVKSNFLTQRSDSAALEQAEQDLHDGFENLKNMFEIMQEKGSTNYPVAFASNALYALEKNGLRNEEVYEQILFPILQEKAQYLHAEGLAGSLWALSQYDNADSDLVLELLNQYQNKKFATEIVYVKNARLSTESFVSAEGTHFYEHDSTQEFKNLYFKDHIICLELYEGLKNLSNKSLSSEASSKISEIVGDLESRHSITSDSYSFYKQLSEGSPTPATS